MLHHTHHSRNLRTAAAVLISGKRVRPGVLQEGTRLCFIRIHKVEEAAHPVLRVLKRAVPNFHRDIAVVNAGLHYGVGDPAYRWVAQGKIPVWQLM